jgi:hypothetical protein
MSTPFLFAFPDIVVIDGKAGQTIGSTSIFYSGSDIGLGRPILWERFVGRTPWTRIDPLAPPRVISSPSGDPKLAGVYIESLKAGQIYQVVMYYTEFIDPNVIDPMGSSDLKPDASSTVIAMLKKPAPADLILSQDQNVGGTWFQKTVQTSTPTFFMLQASKTPSFSDQDGIERFFAPLEAAFSSSFKKAHDELLAPFLPGNDFFFLLRVADEEGNWQVSSGLFHTKQRKLTIEFEVLHIINDGAAGDTTAEFRIWLMEGKAIVKDYFFGDVNNFPISDRPSPGKEATEWIPLALLCEPFVIGPKDVTDSTNEIGLLTRGLCYRAFGSNDWVANYLPSNEFPSPDPTHQVIFLNKTIFPIPTGIGERVQHVPFVTRAVRDTVNVEFEYDITAFFSVDYV